MKGKHSAWLRDLRMSLRQIDSLARERIIVIYTAKSHRNHILLNSLCPKGAYCPGALPTSPLVQVMHIAMNGRVWLDGFDETMS